MHNSPADSVSYSSADIDTATEHALVALLWSEYDYAGGEPSEPLDAAYGPDDVAPDSRASLRAELASFVESIDDEYTDAFEGVTPEQLGHDFILTRNGHGAGFWDRGRGAAGDVLTAMCKPCGTLTAYVGDDGQIHTE